MLGPEHSQGWVTDREVLPGCARVRTKCTEKTSVDLWGQSGDPNELPGVTGVLQFGIRADPRSNSGVCGSVGGHVEHVPALGAQTGAKGGSSWTGG